MRRIEVAMARVKLCGFVALAMFVAGGASGCALEASDSAPDDEEVIAEAGEELTVDEVARQTTLPGEAEEDGEGEDPSPLPWKARAINQPGSPGDPDPWMADAANTTTTTRDRD
jgi:hypothetical protein